MEACNRLKYWTKRQIIPLESRRVQAESRPIEIGVDLQEVDGSTVLVRITTPLGLIEIIGEVEQVGRALTIERMHVQGLGRGALGRRGLNAVARKVMDECDVDTLVIAGAIRTRGRNPGRSPRSVTFRR